MSSNFSTGGSSSGYSRQLRVHHTIISQQHFTPPPTEFQQYPQTKQPQSAAWCHRAGAEFASPNFNSSE